MEQTILMPEGREFQVKERASTRTLSLEHVGCVCGTARGLTWLRAVSAGENGDEGRKVTGPAKI